MLCFSTKLHHVKRLRPGFTSAESVPLGQCVLFNPAVPDLPLRSQSICVGGPHKEGVGTGERRQGQHSGAAIAAAACITAGHMGRMGKER